MGLDALFHEGPDDDAGGGGDIERVLGAVLWDFQTAVAMVNDILMHALNLIAQDDSIPLSFLRMEIIEHGGTVALLYGKYLIALLMERLEGIESGREILPIHAILRSEGCLVDFLLCLQRAFPCGLQGGRVSDMSLIDGIWRGGYATEIDAFHAESVACAEYAAHIIERADIIEHHYERQFLRFLELLHREAVHFQYA